MATRYQHTFPQVRKRKQAYCALFDNPKDKAALAYGRDMAFRTFVNEWNADAPELFSWTITDFYTAYKNGGYQLKLSI